MTDEESRLEYVLLNRTELWEIDYNKKSADVLRQQTDGSWRIVIDNPWMLLGLYLGVCTLLF